MKKLKELLKGVKFAEIKGEIDIPVTSIEFDSRKVAANQENCYPLYLAQKGTRVDGHHFIEQAIQNGAKVVVCEELPEQIAENVTYVLVRNAASALGYMASAFFDHPSRKLKLVGVTGTNGKTTIATLLYRLFSQMGYPSGLLSTIENIVNGEVIPTTHTTPDAVALNKLLHKMVEEGCQYCFMEVSSHAVCQHRIAGLQFSGAVFTNITHDHLDFHGNFMNYIKAKKAFFDSLPKTAFALTNKDDKNGMVMVQNSKAKINTYSLNKAADFKGKILDNSFEGLHLMMNRHEVFFKLTGKFNAYNLLAIYGTAFLLGLPEEEILLMMSSLDSAAGRFQLISDGDGRKAVVDYAHTPDALLNVLSTIKEIGGSNFEIITVVGCGGDRDALKRPEMAAVACKYSDKIILTSDNPRSEDPYKILSDMEKGIPVYSKQKVLTIESRKEAIKTACMLLPKGGVLLVAGKGHENYQEINGVKHHFDDAEIVRSFFNANLEKNSHNE